MTIINHEIKVESDMDKIYQALTTLDGLKSWHSEQVEGQVGLNDEMTMKHTEHPSFSWKITELKPNQRVVWDCVDGPNDAPGTQVSFNLVNCQDGRVMVECAHEGWPDKEGNFRKCNTLWGMLLYHLKKYVETGVANPMFH